ncbi:unnamed protein product, partial [Phaeothamnion confervicola]
WRDSKNRALGTLATMATSIVAEMEMTLNKLQNSELNKEAAKEMKAFADLVAKLPAPHDELARKMIIQCTKKDSAPLKSRMMVLFVTHEIIIAVSKLHTPTFRPQWASVIRAVAPWCLLGMGSAASHQGAALDRSSLSNVLKVLKAWLWADKEAAAGWIKEAEALRDAASVPGGARLPP